MSQLQRRDCKHSELVYYIQYKTEQPSTVICENCFNDQSVFVIKSDVDFIIDLRTGHEVSLS